MFIRKNASNVMSAIFMVGRVLKELSTFAEKKQSIESQRELDPHTKRHRIEALKVLMNNTECSVEDLSLTFW